MSTIRKPAVFLSAVVLAVAFASGCHTIHRPPAFAVPDVPNELNKVNLPEYRVEPPDILQIEAVRTIPRPPYKVEPLDVLYVVLENPVPNQPLAGPVTVDPDGTINLGPTYGKGLPVSVVGKTLAEVKAALEKHLVTQDNYKDPKFTVSLAQGRAAQRISGLHLIRPDGTISLGTYGSVRVTGLTLAEARRAIEVHLSAYLLDPEVAVDVQGYNSKIYYVILDGGGAGQTVVRLPVTGNETVMDAVSQLRGLTPVSSQDRIWVSRPAPAGCGSQVLPVDWRAVAEKGDTATNYQLLPGDRVYVAAYPLSALDIKMARAIAPLERLFGITLLGTSTASAIRHFNDPVGGVGVGGGF